MTRWPSRLLAGCGELVSRYSKVFAQPNDISTPVPLGRALAARGAKPISECSCYSAVMSPETEIQKRVEEVSRMIEQLQAEQERLKQKLGDLEFRLHLVEQRS